MKVKEEGAGLLGETLEPPLVQSDDPNFRPTGVDVAPDGSVYFLDWQNPIIGHMQHHLRDPNRDHQHGRIYRITYEGRPLLKPAKIARGRIEKLLDLLKEPENNVRTRAKIELGARDTKQVVAAVQKWARQFSAAKPEDQHSLLEALWVYQWHNVVNEPLLRQMLKSPEPRARAQAVRVLCYWRDRVHEPLALLRAAANDLSPRVRLEAVRAASFLSGREALEAAYEILKYDTDYYLDYALKETLRQLQKGSKEIFLPQDPQVLAKALDRLSDKELLQAPDVEAVVMERLRRKGIDVNSRSSALDQLAKLHKTDRVSEAITALRRLDSAAAAPSAAADLGLLLTATPAPDLAKSRASLSNLADTARQTPVRRAAYAALVAADGKPDTVWAATAQNPETRATLIDSLILLADPSFRTAFEPLLTAALADATTQGNVRSAALSALPLMGTDNAGKNFGILASHLRDGRDLTAAARAETQLPRDGMSHSR